MTDAPVREEIGAAPGGAAKIALAVDLDGTLIKSDLLAECFAAGLAQSPLATLSALLGGGGRAGLKARLAELARPDPASLPYREAVLERVRRARAEGRETALVSASDARLVRAVAEHLGIFDAAFGSEDGVNLKGAAKRALLVARYGAQGFDYIGDSRVDLEVWPHARAATTVAAGPGLVRAVQAVAPGADHLAPPPAGLGRLRPYLQAMRPHQWLKNTIVFLPLLAAHATDPGAWGLALLAFLAFSLAASAVYLVNDLVDLAADRAHPRKRARPFASGSAKLVPGGLLAAGLALGAAGIALFLPLAFGLVLAGYGALTFAYSFWLKRLLLIDIVTLAGLYTVRVIAGGAATGIAISPWMLGFSVFLFLSLAAVKRQAELVDAAKAGRARAHGRAWEAEDAPIAAMFAVASGHAAVVVLALYIAGADVQALYATPEALWAACPVLLYWLGRFALLAHRGQMHDDPLAFAIRDRTSLLCAGLIALAGAVAMVA